MKFKYLIIVFSAIMIIMILATAFLPLITAGQSLLINFNYITLPLIIFLGAILVCMIILLLYNYKLLSLLEREDWPALAYYLEQKIFIKGHYTVRNIKILASSYLVISDYQSVLKLEYKAQMAKSSVIDSNVMIFGSARILSGAHEDAAVFFRTHLDRCPKKDKQWARWFYGFSSLLSGNFSQAENEFVSLSVSSDNLLICGLCAYFLASSLEKKSANPEKCRNTSVNGKNRVVKAVKNPAGWKKETAKMGTDVHIAIIKRYTDETGKWLFEKT